MEELLRHGPDPVRGHGLRDAVSDRRHPERPGAAPGLGDLHRPHRRRQVTPRRHPVPDLVEVVLQPLLEGRDGLPVHPRRSLVVPHLLPGAPDLIPGDRERLPVQRPPGHRPARLPSGLSSSMTLLPAPLVDETNKATSKPAPSLPAPPRQAGGSALLRAGPTASPATVSAPRAITALAGIPLTAPPGAAYPGWPSAVPCGRRRPGSRHLYAGHHLASNPGNRQAHPGDFGAPRF